MRGFCQRLEAHADNATVWKERMTNYQGGTRFARVMTSVPVWRAFLVFTAALLAGACTWPPTVLVAGAPDQAFASALGPDAEEYVNSDTTLEEWAWSDSEDELSSIELESELATASVKTGDDESSGTDAAAPSAAPTAPTECTVSGEDMEASPAGDGQWKSQLGIWHALNDLDAIEAAKDVSRAAAEASASARTLPSLAHVVPGIVALAIASFGAGLITLVIGRRKRETAPRTAPVKRRPIK